MKNRAVPPVLVCWLLVGAAACVPLPTQVNRDVHTLHDLALRVGAQHATICTAPAPQTGEVPQKPRACAPLKDCLDHLAEASAACTSLQGRLATDGRGALADCAVPRDAALAVCRATGFSPRPTGAGGADGGADGGH